MNQVDTDEQRYLAVASADVDSQPGLEAAIGALYDDSWRVRRAAAHALGTGRNEQIVARLLQVLGDRGQTGARNAAAEALVRRGPAAIDALEQLLLHADPDQRKFAAEILGQIGVPDVAGPLIDALDDEDLNVRVSAAESLGQVGGPEATHALEQLLMEDEPILQIAALESLLRLRVAPPLPALAAMLRDRKLRRSAYRALGLVAQPQAAQLLCGGLSDPNQAARLAALAGLGIQATSDPQSRAAMEGAVRAEVRRSDELRALLQKGLEAESREARVGAVVIIGLVQEARLAGDLAECARDDALFEEITRALARLGSAAGPTLLARLPELSAPARSAAIEALAQAADPALVPALIRFTESADPELQLLGVRALAHVRSPAARHALVPLLKQAHLAPVAARGLVALAETDRVEVVAALTRELQQGTSALAVKALAQIEPEALRPLLKMLCRDADASVRAAAIRAASELGSEECLEAARLGLSDETAVVRAAAAKSVGGCGAGEATALLLRALGDEDPSVRLAAIEASVTQRDDGLAARLETFVRGEDGLLAARALRTLSRLGKVNPGLLNEAARHPDPEVVKEALSAAALTPGAPGLALTLLEHPRWDVRAAAAQVIAAAGDRDLGDRLKAQLGREADPLVKKALAEALRRITAR